MKTKETEDSLLSTSEAAETIGEEEKVIYHLISRGLIVFVEMPPLSGNYLIPERQLIRDMCGKEDLNEEMCKIGRGLIIPEEIFTPMLHAAA